MKPLASDRAFLILLAAVLAVALLLVISIATPFGLSAYLANVIGQLAAFVVLALSLDLIWGYLGILSLGHGLFFGIGGACPQRPLEMASWSEPMAMVSAVQARGLFMKSEPCDSHEDRAAKQVQLFDLSKIEIEGDLSAAGRKDHESGRCPQVEVRIRKLRDHFGAIGRLLRPDRRAISSRVEPHRGRFDRSTSLLHHYVTIGGKVHPIAEDHHIHQEQVIRHVLANVLLGR